MNDITTESRWKTHGGHPYWVIEYRDLDLLRQSLAVSVNSSPLHEAFGHADIIYHNFDRTNLLRVL